MRTGVAAAALLLGTVAAGPAVAAAPAPLEQARQAAEHTDFDGVLEVRWWDGATTQSQQLTVQAAGGSVTVRGATLVMAKPALGPLLAQAGGGWEEMWLPSLALTPRPDGSSKYVTMPATDGPTVAGRTTRVVDVRRDGALQERIYLDTQTSLLLERDQYDAGGRVIRTLAFDSVRIGPEPAPPADPPSPAHHAPSAVSPERMARTMAAPTTLADGYQRLGIYRSGDVVQVLYSDGLYDLSLFEQQGRLRRSDLPGAGEPVAVGRMSGWRYPWPGGQLVVWSSAGKVFTAVSDAPADQVLTAVRSLPPTPARQLSLMGKLRRACQALMEPLS